MRDIQTLIEQIKELENSKDRQEWLNALTLHEKDLLLRHLLPRLENIAIMWRDVILPTLTHWWTEDIEPWLNEIYDVVQIARLEDD